MREGIDYSEILTTLVRQVPDIVAIELHEICVPPSLQNRIPPRSDLQHVANQALVLRAQFGYPFWDALLLSAERNGKGLPTEILDGAGYHQAMTGSVWTKQLSAEEVTPGVLAHIASNVGRGNIIVISSRVITRSEGEAHLPLLDFSLPPSEVNVKIVEQVVRRMGLSGYILASGNSYHFYGSHLVSPGDYRQLLGKALLYTPLVDHRWIGHQLIEGASALRVSANKVGAVPCFEMFVE